MPHDPSARRWGTNTVRTSGLVVGHFPILSLPTMIWTTHFFSLLALAASLPLSDSDSESTKNLDNWSVYITNPDETTTWQPGGSYPVQWYGSTF